MDDAALLREFVARRSQAAFRELVRRHTALGAMACLDLDGKVVWNKRIPIRGGTAIHTFDGCGSPLLIGDRLF